MSPLVAYHCTRRACRESIQENGLLPGQPTKARPFGVYVYREDGGINHPTRDSHVSWCCAPNRDVWKVAYIGPTCMDIYVFNGLILLEPAEHVTLVTSNLD